MSRRKPEEPQRGVPITLPDWFLDALHEKCGDRPRREIVDDLNAVTQRDPPWSLSAVYDFLTNKVTTKAMLVAFLALYPDLPPPIFYASSEEEARRFQQLAQLFSRPVTVHEAPKVTQTIEDTGEKTHTRTGEKRTPAQVFSRPVTVHDVPKVTETIEDTGEKTRTRTGEKRTPAERVPKRAK